MNGRLVKTGALLALALLATGAAALEIQLSPPTLVLSSAGDQLTIHTDFPFRDMAGVVLDIGENTDVEVSKWADDRGNLVARCSKVAVREAVGEFDTQFTWIDVTLAVLDRDHQVHSATEVLRVRR